MELVLEDAQYGPYPWVEAIAPISTTAATTPQIFTM
jgi:hypothetical protein